MKDKILSKQEIAKYNISKQEIDECNRIIDITEKQLKEWKKNGIDVELRMSMQLVDKLIRYIRFIKLLLKISSKEIDYLKKELYR